MSKSEAMTDIIERAAVTPFEPFSSHTITLTTPELRQGDVVHCHGMLCLIDIEPHLSKGHAGGQTYHTAALVLNREDVPGDYVPYGWTVRGHERDDTGARMHRWTIQGNELAHWCVTR